MKITIKTLKAKGKDVRIALNGKNYFCAMDICKVLGIKNGKDIISKHFNEDEIFKYPLLVEVRKGKVENRDICFLTYEQVSKLIKLKYVDKNTADDLDEWALLVSKDKNQLQPLSPAIQEDQRAIATDVKLFNFEAQDIRVIIENDEPLFCLTDICKTLELTNINNVKTSLDMEFDKGGMFNITPLQTNGGLQKITFINESELYFVLMRSRSEKAKPFRQWITKEVLPSLRKTGAYSVSQFKAPTNMIEALELALEQAKQIEALKIKQEKERPLVEFAQKVTNTEDAISVQDFAKLLSDKKIKMGQNRLFQWLRDKEYLMRDNKPYQRYIDSGYFKVVEEVFTDKYGKEKIYLKTLITGKGQTFFTNILQYNRQGNEGGDI